MQKKKHNRNSHRSQYGTRVLSAGTVFLVSIPSLHFNKAHKYLLVCLANTTLFYSKLLLQLINLSFAVIPSTTFQFKFCSHPWSHFKRGNKKKFKKSRCFLPCICTHDSHKTPLIIASDHCLPPQWGVGWQAGSGRAAAGRGEPGPWVCRRSLASVSCTVFRRVFRSLMTTVWLWISRSFASSRSWSSASRWWCGGCGVKPKGEESERLGWVSAPLPPEFFLKKPHLNPFEKTLLKNAKMSENTFKKKLKNYFPKILQPSKMKSQKLDKKKQPTPGKRMLSGILGRLSICKLMEQTFLFFSTQFDAWIALGALGKRIIRNL